MSVPAVPQPSAPMVDLTTGAPAPVWFRFLSALARSSGTAPAALVLQPGATLGLTDTTLYTAPASGSVVVRQAAFANATTNRVTLSVTIARAGGAPPVLIARRILAASESYAAPEMASLVLSPGDSILARADASDAVSAVLSGSAA